MSVLVTRSAPREAQFQHGKLTSREVAPLVIKELRGEGEHLPATQVVEPIDLHARTAHRLESKAIRPFYWSGGQQALCQELCTNSFLHSATVSIILTRGKHNERDCIRHFPRPTLQDPYSLGNLLGGGAKSHDARMVCTELLSFVQQ